MSQSISAYSVALKLRCELAITTLCHKHGLDVPHDESDLAVEAYLLGLRCPDAPSPPILFAGTLLADQFAEGAYLCELASMSDDGDRQEEWDALTPDEQFREWDCFHDLCMLGVADDMYFYEVLMRQHLVGYVGH